jgi:type I restriction-modification system DNA methylase subunit
MDRAQAITLVRDTFTQRFDDERFTLFTRNLLNHLEESKKQTWTLKKAAFEDFVNHFTRLGTYTDPRGERLDVLVIHLRKDTTLARCRVTLRNFVADYLATGHGRGKAAVIAAFVSPEEKDDWRFSFVKLDYSLEKTELGIVTERAQLTPARRYSYLVGKNENCHTAQKQFLELLQTDTADPTLAQLETAFSVEKVTREFYDHYKDLFEKTRDALKVVLKEQSSIASHFDERGIENDDFAKKLLGQIVFLYFLQKKGWFGVEPRKAWGTGRKDFIRHLFRERASFASLLAKKAKRETNFFNDILEPLFYEALAIDRSDNGDHYSLFDCKIPFLNGGLFEPIYGYQWQTTDILLPDALFSNDEPTGEENESGTGILDVFDRYNFTVNEAEPLEKEVAVDPEMLGKVFENLLPENIRHASGTYYTPRVIVHYMCQEALLHYLAARAPQVPQNDLALFLRHAERFADFEAKGKKSYAERGLLLPESISQNAAPLDDLLATITVCDPAIGSGAFPVGMMHEIVRARIALTPALEKSGDIRAQKLRSAYALKRDAIHHSLYGVDLDPGAVEIAKLRLWLSMVVDEEEIGHIQPLPNLDYKIMQGNSLLEEFDGIRLLDEKLLKPPDAARDSELPEIRASIAALQSEAIRRHGEGKKGAAQKLAAEQEIKRLKKRLDVVVNPAEAKTGAQGELNQQTSWASLKRIQELHAKFFDENSRAEKDRLRKELDALEWNFMEATLREQGREEAIAELKRASAKHRKPFFLWRLHFGDIFQQRGGFDVVIANPPYVRQEKIKDQKGALKSQYPNTYVGTADIYVYFYDRAIQLLREGGALAFITSNKWYRVAYGEKLRKHIGLNTSLIHAIDFGDAPVFTAIAYPTIIIAKKAKPESGHFFGALNWNPDASESDLARFADFYEANAVRMSQQTLTSDGWRFLAPSLQNLLNSIHANGIPLGKFVNGCFYNGIKTGLNDAFVIDRSTRNRLVAEDEHSEDLLKPFLRGRDVKRWRVESADKWLIYLPWHFPFENDSSVETASEKAEMEFRSKYPAIHRYVAQFKKELLERDISEVGIRYEWYALSRPRLENKNAFYLPKVVIPCIESDVAFAVDRENYFGNDKTSIIVADEPDFLCAVLNSSVHWWYAKEHYPTKQGGFVEFKPTFMAEFPIPNSDVAQKASIERLVTFLSWLHREVLPQKELAGSAGATLLAGYFEQWVNALVYELFFPEQLHAAGLHFFRLTEQAKLPALSEIKGQELSALRAKFEELYAPNHPLRQGLFALDSVEEIRIIEGKA